MINCSKITQEKFQDFPFQVLFVIGKRKPANVDPVSAWVILILHLLLDLQCLLNAPTEFTLCAGSVRELKLDIGVGSRIQKAKLSDFMVYFLSYHCKTSRNDGKMTGDKLMFNKLMFI